MIQYVYMTEKYNIPEKHSLDSMEGIEQEDKFSLHIDRAFIERGLSSGELKKLNSKILEIISDDPDWLTEDNLKKIKSIGTDVEGDNFDESNNIHPLLANKTRGTISYMPDIGWISVYETFKTKSKKYSLDEREEIIRKGFSGHGHEMFYDFCMGSESGRGILMVQMYEQDEIKRKSPLLYSVGVLPYTFVDTLKIIVMENDKLENGYFDDEFNQDLIDAIRLYLGNLSKMTYFLAHNSKINISELDNEFMDYSEYQTLLKDMTDGINFLQNNYHRSNYGGRLPTQEEINASVELLKKIKMFFIRVSDFLNGKIGTK